MQHKNSRLHWRVHIQMEWHLKYQHRVKMTVEVTYTMYCKELPYHLLLYQHWSQQCKQPSYTYFKLGHDCTELVWNRGTLKRRVRLKLQHNSEIIRSVLGY